MLATIDTSVAVLLTGGFTLAATVIAGFFSLRALRDQQTAERRREDRAHIRSVLEAASTDLYRAFLAISAGTEDPIPASRIEESGRAFQSTRGRLLLYFDDTHDVYTAFDQTVKHIMDLARVRFVTAEGTPQSRMAEAEKARAAYGASQHKFYAASRQFLGS